MRWSSLKAKTKPKIYRSHEALSRTYEVRGDFGKALEHHRAFQQVKEEVLGEESNTKLQNLQIKFEAETLEKIRDDEEFQPLVDWQAQFRTRLDGQSGDS